MPVNVLCPITVVAIRIHDSNPSNAIFLSNIFHHDRFDVDVAKPTIAMNHTHGMVPGGAYQGKAVVRLAVYNHLHAVYDGPGCETGRVI